MITKIVIFLIGILLGFAISWTYNQVTDKMSLAKGGFKLGKIIVNWILSKFKKQ